MSLPPTSGTVAAAPPNLLMLRTCLKENPSAFHSHMVDFQEKGRRACLDLQLEELNVVDDLIKHRSLVRLQLIPNQTSF